MPVSWSQKQESPAESYGEIVEALTERGLGKKCSFEASCLLSLQAYFESSEGSFSFPTEPLVRCAEAPVTLGCGSLHGHCDG